MNNLPVFIEPSERNITDDSIIIQKDFDTDAMGYLLRNYIPLIVMQDIKENTRRKYLSNAESFISFISDNGFNEYSVLAYKEFIRKSIGLSDSAKVEKIRIAKFLTRSLWYKGITGEFYGSNVKNFRLTKEHKKKGLVKKDIDKIFNYLSLLPRKMKIEIKRKGKSLDKHHRVIKTNKERDILMTSLLTYQGFRQFELCGIEINDISLKNETIKILGKARDVKESVNMHPKTVDAIDKYLSFTGIKSGFLIPSRRKTKLSTSSIRSIYKDKRHGIFNLLDIDIKKSVHGFRHYFITTLLDKFQDPMIAMKFARIKTVETIKLYDDREMQEYLKVFAEAF